MQQQVSTPHTARTRTHAIARLLTLFGWNPAILAVAIDDDHAVSYEAGLYTVFAIFIVPLLFFAARHTVLTLSRAVVRRSSVIVVKAARQYSSRMPVVGSNVTEPPPVCRRDLETSPPAGLQAQSPGPCADDTDARSPKAEPFRTSPPAHVARAGAVPVSGPSLSADTPGAHKVDSQVVHPIRGRGRVVKVDLNDPRGRPIHVRFDDGEVHHYTVESAAAKLDLLHPLHVIFGNEKVHHYILAAQANDEHVEQSTPSADFGAGGRVMLAALEDDVDVRIKWQPDGANSVDSAKLVLSRREAIPQATPPSQPEPESRHQGGR